MTLCVENNFDVILTIDKNIAFQQNLDQYKLTIVVLNSLTSKIEELILFMPSLEVQLPKLEKFKAYFIDK